MSEKIRVLFVCLGNICRSPVAEGVFRDLVSRAGLTDAFEIDSAGTSDFHTGDAPDERTVEVALRRGIRLEHAARQATVADMDRFHYVLAMDASNLEKLERLAERSGSAVDVRLLRSFDEAAGEDRDVPDPYFGGADGFEEVHDMVERACAGLLGHIRSQRLQP